MNSKLKIKIGQIEIDCEATEDFLKEEVPVLLRAAIELAQLAPAGVAGGSSTRTPTGGEANASERLSLTTASIAAKLDAKTGPDLLLAAAAQLTFVAGKEVFTRDEILTSMKSASSYYQKNYSSNLSKMLAQAISNQVFAETARNTYAITAGVRASLGARLANN